MVSLFDCGCYFRRISRRSLARDRARHAWQRRPERLSLLLFQYWERYAETLRLVIQAGNPDILLERLKAYLKVMLNELAGKRRQPARDPRLQELIVGYVAGGAYMLLTAWVTQKMPFSAEQMGLLFSALTAPCETIQLAR